MLPILFFLKTFDTFCHFFKDKIPEEMFFSPFELIRMQQVAVLFLR